MLQISPTIKKDYWKLYMQRIKYFIVGHRIMPIALSYVHDCLMTFWTYTNKTLKLPQEVKGNIPISYTGMIFP